MRLMHCMQLGWAGTMLSGLLMGCTTVDPSGDYRQMQEHVTGATGHQGVYQPGDEERVSERVGELLADGLTANEAVQVCLLNNPSFQAAAMAVGMSRADLLQSGLLSNPTVRAALELPAGGGLAYLEGGLAQNIADLWQIPIRKRAAQHSLDQAILTLARQAANLAAEAKSTYYQAVGAEQVHDITQENLKIAQQLLDLTISRQKAGAGSMLDVNLSRESVLEMELNVEAARLAAAEARRSLATLIGITNNADDLALSDPLPMPPEGGLETERLIGLARSARLDIRAAQQAAEAARERIKQEWRRIFPNVDVGVAFERGARKAQGGRDIPADTARASIANGRLTAPEIQPRSERRTNTDFIIGPSVDLELPIFDQNQARIAKATFVYREAVKTHEALDRAVVHEVRGAVDRAETASKLVRYYKDRSLPLAKSNLDLSRESYQAGQASFLAVLEAQRFFIQVRRRLVETMQGAAKTIPAIENAVGLPMDRVLSGPAGSVQSGEPVGPPYFVEAVGPTQPSVVGPPSPGLLLSSGDPTHDD